MVGHEVQVLWRPVVSRQYNYRIIQMFHELYTSIQNVSHTTERFHKESCIPPQL